MLVRETSRGFEIIDMPVYLCEDGNERNAKLVQQSSMVGNYPDAFDRPGSSFLWIGKDHHLNRVEALELGRRIVRWAETGSLKLEGE